MAIYRLFIDTQEGEKCYDGVEIAADETIGDVLNVLIAELHESELTIAGISAGDLRVIWNGRELDLSRTLPEQEVQENDTLRILSESYEGGGNRLRQIRVENELSLLCDLEEVNRDVLTIEEVQRGMLQESVIVTLKQTRGIAKLNGAVPTFRDSHRFRLVFPRYYPEMAIECYTVHPLVHPNVSPESGFFCLWRTVSPEGNIIEAICRAQAATAFRIANLDKNHWMNPAAANWYQLAQPRREVPFGYKELVTFRVMDGKVVWINPKQNARRFSRQQ